MWTLTKLAFRNVFRSKRRTFITFSTVSLGLALLILSVSLIDGIDKQSKSNIINSQTSHLTLFQKGYFDKHEELPMNLTIKNASAILPLLQKVPAVKAVERRVRFAASLIKGMDELPCLGLGIEPQTDPRLFNIKESLIKGRWLEPGEAQVLLGEDLANDLGLSVGDSITLRMITSSKDEDLSWNAIDVEIKGIFDSGNPGVDSGVIIMPLKQAQEGLSLDSQVTEIVLRLNTDDETVLVSAQTQIQELLDSHKAHKGNYEVVTWKDLAGDFLVISKAKTKNTSIITFVILFIASMGIINTMLMAVLERTREIGMLTALGMKGSEIVKLFVLESGIIGIFGSLAGCILGGLIGGYLEVHGFSMAALGDSVQKITAATYPVKDVFYADVSAGLLLKTFVFGTAIALLVGIYPARKAASLNAVEALRHI